MSKRPTGKAERDFAEVTGGIPVPDEDEDKEQEAEATEQEAAPAVPEPVLEPATPRFNVADLPRAEDAPPIAMAPSAQAKAALPPQFQDAIRGVAAEEERAEAEAKAGGGELRVYYAMRGGKPCNLTIQVKMGIPIDINRVTNEPIQGTGRPPVVIKFGSGSNPPGVYKTSDPEKQKCIEATAKYRSGMIRRADIQSMSKILDHIKDLEALGVKLPPEMSKSLAERMQAATSGIDISHGARTTRSMSTGVSKGFEGIQALMQDPAARALLSGR